MATIALEVMKADFEKKSAGIESLWKISDPSPIVNNDEGNFSEWWTDLPGRNFAPKYPETCGQFLKLQVCDSDETHQHGVFKNCASYDCPICWNAWLSKAAYRVSERIFQWCIAHKHHQVSHWVISPPIERFIYDNMIDYPNRIKLEFDEYLIRLKEFELMIKSIFCLTNDDIFGYTLIFHAYRGRCLICGCSEDECQCRYEKEYDQQDSMEFAFSPHWHVISNRCFIADVSKKFEELGTIIRKISDIPIKDLFATFRYELGHCSKQTRKHAVKYFGLWSYRKIRASDYIDVERPCMCRDCRKQEVSMESFTSDYEIDDIRGDLSSDSSLLLINYVGRSTYKRKVNFYFPIQEWIQKCKFYIKEILDSEKTIPDFIYDQLSGYESKHLNIQISEYSNT